jgi:hypothetical protein
MNTCPCDHTGFPPPLRPTTTTTNAAAAAAAASATATASLFDTLDKQKGPFAGEREFVDFFHLLQLAE